MNKGVVLFFVLISLILAFVFGVRFAYSQSGGFPITPPTIGPWHDASGVVCNGCVGNNNLGVGVVTDSKVSNTAGIHTSKINGGNGWFVTLPNLPAINSWVNAPSTMLLPIGQNWNGKIVEMLCGSTQEIYVGSGVFTTSTTNIIRNTHKILTLNPGTLSRVYYASDTATQTGTQYQALEVSPNPFDATQLRFRRLWVPGSIIGGGNQCSGLTCEPQYSQFYCVIKLIN